MRIVKGAVRVSPGFIEIFSDTGVPIVRVAFEDQSPEDATIELSDPAILGTIGLTREFMFMRVPGVTSDTWKSRIELIPDSTSRDGWQIASGQDTYKESRQDDDGYLFQLDRWV